MTVRQKNDPTRRHYEGTVFNIGGCENGICSVDVEDRWNDSSERTTLAVTHRVRGRQHRHRFESSAMSPSQMFGRGDRMPAAIREKLGADHQQAETSLRDELIASDWPSF